MPGSLYYNEQDLLTQIAEGNEHAFRQFFHTYRNKLYSYILKISESKETAEDTVHDVFLKIWIRREKLPEIQNLDAYLFRMARNQAYNGFRRMATETLLKSDLRKHADFQSNNPEAKLVSKEVMRLIQDAVNKLTPQQKEVFKMSRELGLRQKEIAQQLDISISTVKKHMTNALNKLRDELSDHKNLQAVLLFAIYYLCIDQSYNA